MSTRRKLDLVQIIKRWDNLPHQRAALNILQEVLPPELLDPQSEWIDCWYSDTIEKPKQK